MYFCRTLLKAPITSLFLRLQMRGFRAGVIIVQETEMMLSCLELWRELGRTYMNVAAPQNIPTTVKWEEQVTRAFCLPSFEGMWSTVSRINVQEARIATKGGIRKVTPIIYTMSSYMEVSAQANFNRGRISQRRWLISRDMPKKKCMVYRV